MTGSPVRGFADLSLWVGSARHASSFFCNVLGFAVVEDGVVRGDQVSYVVQQGDAHLVLTGAVAPESPVAQYVASHGDGVRDIGLEVDDIDAMHRRAVELGATPTGPGCTVAAFGDTTHTFFPRRNTRERRQSPVGLCALDHLAISVEPGTREHWARHYEQVFGFERVGVDEHVEINGSAFNMTTVRAARDRATLVIVEPAPGERRSQIADYLDHFRGPGVHHVAFSTDDILSTVAALRDRGVRLLDVPPGYHEQARARLDGLDVPWAELERYGVLVDRDARGHLLQVFTEPIGDRPTMYLEIIERHGTDGFGNENVRALYDAVARASTPAGTPGRRS